MRKVNNNKYRNNNNNNNSIYSLNYKFDSMSSAGKLSGTALDLIKKYNELAKEAHSNGNYVEMEVFRQYAEHYRKIVTEINERKNQMRENAQNNNENETTPAENAETSAPNGETPAENQLVETEAAAPSEQPTAEPDTTKTKAPRSKRSFTVIEVAPENTEAPAKPRRRLKLNKQDAPQTSPEIQEQTNG